MLLSCVARGQTWSPKHLQRGAEPDSEEHRQSSKGRVRDGLRVTLVCGNKSQCGAHWPDSFVGSHEAGEGAMRGEDTLPEGFPNSANLGSSFC